MTESNDLKVPQPDGWVELADGGGVLMRKTDAVNSREPRQPRMRARKLLTAAASVLDS